MSRVSAHERLNVTRDFGPHGCLPGIKILYVCIEAATYTLHDPLKCGTWVLTQEWALARDTTVVEIVEMF